MSAAKNKNTDIQEQNIGRVARFLSSAIDQSGKTQKTIALEVGFNAPHTITMLKQGNTKVPLDRATKLAVALEVSAPKFMDLILGEYFPNAKDAIRQAYGADLSDEDRNLLAYLHGEDVKVYLTKEAKERLSALLK